MNSVAKFFITLWVGFCHFFILLVIAAFILGVIALAIWSCNAAFTLLGSIYGPILIGIICVFTMSYCLGKAFDR